MKAVISSDKIWNEDDPKDMEHEIKVANVICGKCEIEGDN